VLTHDARRAYSWARLGNRGRGGGSMRLVLPLVLCLAFAAPAFADTITEVGDAGQTLATAQDITGGAFDRITGSMDTGNDADLFKFIAVGGFFEATTNGESPQLSDPQLWLFDAGGLVVTGNDDFFGLQSYISANLTAGATYYIGITQWNNDPAGSPLSGWTNNSFYGTGDYSISLSTTAPVPEPLTLGLFGVGAGAVFARRRMRRRR
jgi:PEP-CTERM motif